VAVIDGRGPRVPRRARRSAPRPERRRAEHPGARGRSDRGAASGAGDRRRPAGGAGPSEGSSNLRVTRQRSGRAQRSVTMGVADSRSPGTFTVRFVSIAITAPTITIDSAIEAETSVR